MDEDFSGVVQQGQVDVAVRLEESDPDVRHIPFDWGVGYGVVNRGDIRQAVAELQGEGAAYGAILEVSVDDTLVAAQDIDLTVGPGGPAFTEADANTGCGTYTSSGGIEARTIFHAVSVPVGQGVDTPYATELDPLGGTGPRGRPHRGRWHRGRGPHGPGQGGDRRCGRRRPRSGRPRRRRRAGGAASPTRRRVNRIRPAPDGGPTAPGGGRRRAVEGGTTTALASLPRPPGHRGRAGEGGPTVV